MEVKRLVNSIFNSNSYVLTKKGAVGVWVIDPGDTNPILAEIKNHGGMLNGILLTHTHFDHIYGLQRLVDTHPNVTVYTSQYGIEGLKCDKLNGSRYMEFPFTVNVENVNIVKEGDVIQLWDGDNMVVWETTGHNRDCVSFYIPGFVFTGDALIPDLKVVAKSKYANKDEVITSLHKILTLCKDDDIICPGHNQRCILNKCNLPDLK